MQLLIGSNYLPPEVSLVDVLREELNWGVYESSAYKVLVEEGPLKANELAMKAKIPTARIYGILDMLEKRGYIRKRAKRPTIYDAQHPRSVLEKEKEDFNHQINEAIIVAEQKWELRGEHKDGLENGWTVSGYFGFVTELRRLMPGITKSIEMLDADISWLRRKDIELLSELKSKVGIRILSSRIAADELQELLEKGIEAKIGSPKESFYIIDGSLVIVKLSSPDGAVIYRDEALASVMCTHFDECFEQGKELK